MQLKLNLSVLLAISHGRMSERLMKRNEKMNLLRMGEGAQVETSSFCQMAIGFLENVLSTPWCEMEDIVSSKYSK